MLTLDPVVNVNVAVAAASVVTTTFDVGLILTTTSETITDRAKVYDSLADVVEDYAATSDEYKAAAKYFGVFPAPRELVIGVKGSSESISDALDAIRFANQDWYGVYMVGADATAIKGIDTWLNDMDYGMQFCAVYNGTLANIATTDPMLTLNANKTMRTHAMYVSSATLYNEAAAVMGMAMGCASANFGTMWQLCYKTITGVTPSSALTQANVESLLAAHVNVYVTRGYTRNMLERGMTPSDLRVDEVIALDRISADIQNGCLDMIMNSAEKLPQNDTTTSRFMAAITEVLEAYVGIGYIQSGIWRGAPFGNVATGDTLEKGYALWADRFDNQTDADRKARMGMPISVAICFAGSVESIVINVSVQE